MQGDPVQGDPVQGDPVQGDPGSVAGVGFSPSLALAGEPASALRRFSWAEAPAGPGYTAIVETMNRGVTALSEAIASELQRVRGGPRN